MFSTRSPASRPITYPDSVVGGVRRLVRRGKGGGEGDVGEYAMVAMPDDAAPDDAAAPDCDAAFENAFAWGLGWRGRFLFSPVTKYMKA